MAAKVEKYKRGQEVEVVEEKFPPTPSPPATDSRGTSHQQQARFTTFQV